MNDPAIEIKNLSKTFKAGRKEIKALQNVSLTIFKNEVFGLLGPNGSGKTTLLRILCTLLSPDKTGDFVEILGEDLSCRKDEIRYKIGYVPQQASLYKDLSAIDNLVFFGRGYNSNKKETREKIQEFLKMMNLWERKDDLAGVFSKGMLQKLSIICSILHSPPLIFFDEVTLGLDIQTQEEIWNLVKELKKDKTIVFTTHYMDEAENLCDRVAILNKGEILDVGSPLDLKNKYQVSHLKEVVKKLTIL